MLLTITSCFSMNSIIFCIKQDIFNTLKIFPFHLPICSPENKYYLTLSVLCFMQISLTMKALKWMNENNGNVQNFHKKKKTKTLKLFFFLFFKGSKNEGGAKKFTWFITSKIFVYVFPAITLQGTVPKECALSKFITVI